MSPELRDILSRYGTMPGFSTCPCAYCFGMREVERRATPRQAFHTVMGAKVFESIAADMGVHWAFVAAFTMDPKPSPALDALTAMSKADLQIDYEPLPASRPQAWRCGACGRVSSIDGSWRGLRPRPCGDCDGRYFDERDVQRQFGAEQ